MEPRLFVFDWSGTISDDRKPVYTANMRLLQGHGKPTMTFEEWLPRTRMTPGEFLADHGIYGDQVVRFQTVEERIETVAQTLAKNYTTKGLMEPEEIMRKYTPQSKGSWAAGVLHFMNEMK